MRIKTRKKIPSIYLYPSDVITLKYNSEPVLKSRIGRELTIDEAVIFDVEEGDFKGAQDGIGGAFLSCKKGGKK